MSLIKVKSRGTDNVSSRRNLLVNGAMNVSQRGTSFVSPTQSEILLDQFRNGKSHDGAITVTQDSSGPSGFANSLKVDVTTADTSIAASQYQHIWHRVEAQNLQSLAFGTSDAKNFTLSFYVKSNKTGTYAVVVGQNDNSFKQATLTYTINSADTWERKSLTFNGDTSGVINDDNGSGLEINFILAIGSNYTSGSGGASFATYADANYAAGHAVNLLDNTSNEWFLTGVQLEVGDSASDFDHRLFAEELRLCQRYFHNVTGAGHPFPVDGAYARYITHSQDANGTKWFYEYPVEMRATPTLTLNNISSSTIQHFNYEAQTGYAMTGASLGESGRRHAHIGFTFASGISVGNTVSWRWLNNPNASWDFNSEL